MDAIPVKYIRTDFRTADTHIIFFRNPDTDGRGSVVHLKSNCSADCDKHPDTATPPAWSRPEHADGA